MSFHRQLACGTVARLPLGPVVAALFHESQLQLMMLS